MLPFEEGEMWCLSSWWESHAVQMLGRERTKQSPLLGCCIWPTHLGHMTPCCSIHCGCQGIMAICFQLQLVISSGALRCCGWAVGPNPALILSTKGVWSCCLKARHINPAIAESAPKPRESEDKSLTRKITTEFTMELLPLKKSHSSRELRCIPKQQSIHSLKGSSSAPFTNRNKLFPCLPRF